MPNDSGQEGRLLLATRAVQSGQISSIRTAVKLYDVPRTTLRRRLNGIQQRSISSRTKHKLTETEEYTLLQWILTMDKHGAPLRPSSVQDMANLLLAKRDASKPSSTVGINWVNKFVRRHDTLKTRFSRKYDYQRALCEDPRKIQEWFKLVRETIQEWGIADEDIYNFDETGFAMGMIATAKVITQAERSSRPNLVQPGNREWVTAIETISASGWVLPPMVIFAGKTHRTNWFEDTDLPPDWTIGVSPNGWTTDELGFDWLQFVFERYTKDRTKGVYRLLILDGHGSHLTPKFDQYYTEHKIIPLCMPPYLSHLLQPLDVGCFSVLKRSYGHQVEQLIRVGIDHIDKADFLVSYNQARTETYKEETIRNAFKSAGLVPYDPAHVLLKLNMVTGTTTPPGSSHGSQSSRWSPQTPQNLRQLQRQTRTIEQHLRRRTIDSASPTKQALNQLVKGCHLAMHNAVLLADENIKLRTANQKQRQKRSKTTSAISQGGILTVQEGLVRTQSVQNGGNMVGEQSVNEPKTRAPSKCSLCSSLEHTARTCAQRSSNNQ